MLAERTSKILCFSPLGHFSVYSLVSYIGINQSMKQLQQQLIYFRFFSVLLLFRLVYSSFTTSSFFLTVNIYCSFHNIPCHILKVKEDNKKACFVLEARKKL